MAFGQEAGVGAGGGAGGTVTIAGMNLTAEPPDATESATMDAGVVTIPVSGSVAMKDVAALPPDRSHTPARLTASTLVIPATLARFCRRMITM